MDFLKEDKDYEGWLPVITVLLGTGMRIGECLGLRWEDLDFKNRMISVNHNLTDRPDDISSWNTQISADLVLLIFLSSSSSMIRKCNLP